MILYPAMDLLDGRVVRLTKGDFNQVRVYSEDPAAVLANFRAAGAAFAHVVDLSGARDPKARQTALLLRLLKTTNLKIQVGGGVRERMDAVRLLDAGAERVVVGSIAVTDPGLGESLLVELGPEHVTLAVDVAIDGEGLARPAIKGWSETTTLLLEDLIARFKPWGLARVLCTDISRDGVAAGPNTELYRGLASRFPGLEVQASGGVRGDADLAALKSAGAHSAIVGTALYEKTVDLRKALKSC
jgi:phosphoribosylformimino-5-aminoimidazole carboxamide ribotide isomerase